MYGKIALILIVVLVVWWGFRALSRWQTAQSHKNSEPPLQVTKDDALDLVHCNRCDAFRPRASGPCERTDCPRT